VGQAAAGGADAELLSGKREAAPGVEAEQRERLIRRAGDGGHNRFVRGHDGLADGEAGSLGK
jgi:hypothetical protein